MAIKSVKNGVETVTFTNCVVKSYAREERTVWQIEVGGLRMRCIASPVESTYEGNPIRPVSAYVVQMQDPKNGWTLPVGTGNDAAELLRRVVSSEAVAKALKARS